MNKKKKIYYGWYVVAAGCISIAMTTGIVNNCFSQFVKPVCADMGITRQQMSMIQTVFSIASMLFAMIWGNLSKRIHLHRWMCICAVVMPIVYGCYGLMPDIRVGYLISIILTPFFFIVSMTVFTYIIGNWFVKNRGLAIGLASMGSGIGGMIMNTVTSQLIIHHGWRMTYFILAIVMFVSMAPPVFLIVREKPSDKGLEPYGADETKHNTLKTTSAFDGYTFTEALHMPSFWALTFCSVSMVMAICIFYQTIAPHLSDCGYSVTFAATVTSVCMGALAIGKVTLGRMFDKLGVRKAVTIACTFTLIGLTGIIFCQNMISLAAIVLGTALGCSFGAVCMPIITQNLFGMKDYNSIYSKLTAATGLGSALAPVISGRTYDTFGTYVPAYAGAAAVTAISIVVLLVFMPKSEKR